MKIIGLTFSFLSAIMICIIPVAKNKKNINKYQIYKTIFGVLANFFLLSYAGVVSTFISLLRNILAIKNKLNLKSQIYLSILLIITGLYFNNRGLIGLLPIIAFIQYTFMALKPNATVLTMKYSFLINVSLWLIHDIYIKAYPTIIANILSLILATVCIVKTLKEEKRKKERILKELSY